MTLLMEEHVPFKQELNWSFSCTELGIPSNFYMDASVLIYAAV